MKEKQSPYIGKKLIFSHILVCQNAFASAYFISLFKLVLSSISLNTSYRTSKATNGYAYGHSQLINLHDLLPIYKITFIHQHANNI